MKSFSKTFLFAFPLVFIMISTTQADCPEGYYAIEENSCCTDGTYNGCCGTYGYTEPSSCSGGDPNYQPSYAYCGSGGCYVWCPDVCQPDPAYNDCLGNHMGDATYDACGVCNGDNSTCTDDCGVVNGDNSTCAGCSDIEALNYDSEAINNEGCCVYHEEVPLEGLADLNNDGVVNVFDAIIMVNVILGI